MSVLLQDPSAPGRFLAPVGIDVGGFVYNAVLGDFDDASITQFGVTSRFYRKGDEFWTQTEGPDGALHDYKIDIAKSMLEMCHAIGGKVLLVCSSTSSHATDDRDALARDLRKLAMLAVPLGIKVAYEGLSWGRTINEFTTAWEVVSRADVPNLGLGLDSFHLFATETPLRVTVGSPETEPAA